MEIRSRLLAINPVALYKAVGEACLKENRSFPVLIFGMTDGESRSRESIQLSSASVRAAMTWPFVLGALFGCFVAKGSIDPA